MSVLAFLEGREFLREPMATLGRVRGRDPGLPGRGPKDGSRRNSLPSGRSSLVAETAEFLPALAPVGIDLDERRKEDFLLEKIFHLDPGFRTDLLQGRPLLPDDDALLAVPEDIDDGCDLIPVFPFLEGFDLNLAAVGVSSE